MYDYVTMDHDWTLGKELMYEENLNAMFFDVRYRDYLCCFKAMNKSGEVYRCANLTTNSQGYTEGRSDRARLICMPAKRAYGPMQATQSYLFKWLTKHIPGFIHGMSTKQLSEHVQKHARTGWRAVWLDGSAYDSSQYFQLMQLVDDRFWRLMEPTVEKIIRHTH